MIKGFIQQEEIIIIYIWYDIYNIYHNFTYTHTQLQIPPAQSPFVSTSDAQTCRLPIGWVAFLCLTFCTPTLGLQTAASGIFSRFFPCPHSCTFPPQASCKLHSLDLLIFLLQLCTQHLLVLLSLSGVYSVLLLPTLIGQLAPSLRIYFETVIECVYNCENMFSHSHSSRSFWFLVSWVIYK